MAGRQLATRRQASPLDDLMAALSSKKPGLRAGALREVANMGEQGAAQYDLDQQVVPLLEDPEAIVQEYALHALGSMGTRGGQYADLVAAKLGSPEKRVKRAAISALGRLGRFGASHADAIEAYLDDKDLDYVVDACTALGGIKATGSAAKLVTKLTSDDEEVVRAATTSLAALDAEADAIAKLLTHRAARTKAAAVAALTSSSKVEAYVEAVAPLVGDEDGFVRIAAAGLVSAVGAKAAAHAPAIGKLLDSENPGVVAAAATALGGIGVGAASEIPQLEKALRVGGEDKSTLVTAIAGVAKKEAATLRKPACAAAAALAALGAPGAKSAPKVAECLNSMDWEVRAAALTALGHMGNEGAKLESAICDLLADQMPAVVSAAAIALGNIALSTSASSATASAVAEHLEDKHPAVRAAVAQSLGMMGEEAQPFLDGLVKLFADRSWPVQVEAVRAVARAGELGQMYAAHVCRLMFDGRTEVRLAAIEALASMGQRGAAFSEEWESLLDDANPEVARAAQRALEGFAAAPVACVTDIGQCLTASAEEPSATRAVTASGKKPIGLLFPGQGSQYVKMLADVKDLPAVKEMTEKAKAILGYDILELCLAGPEDKLEQTKFCQPAMYIGGLAAAELLRRDNPAAVDQCQAVAGLSLGEYTALTMAGVFDFETGLKLVKLRGEAMQEAAELTPQMMVSVAGLDQATLERLCKESITNPKDICQVANFLFPAGFSCAGSKAAVENLIKKATDTPGCLQAKALKTSGAFHTAFMAPARDRLLAALKDVEGKMNPPKCDIYMNVNGGRLAAGTPPSQITSMLGDQLTSCVLWEPAMKNMIKDGVEEFFECGPMKQLKAMMKRIDQEAWKKTTNIHV